MGRLAMLAAMLSDQEAPKRLTQQVVEEWLERIARGGALPVRYSGRGRAPLTISRIANWYKWVEGGPPWIGPCNGESLFMCV